MEKSPKADKPLPTSVRFTADERARLEQAAGSNSLSDYIRMRVLDLDTPPLARRRKVPVKDQAALAKVLALLGASRTPVDGQFVLRTPQERMAALGNETQQRKPGRER